MEQWGRWARPHHLGKYAVCIRFRSVGNYIIDQDKLLIDRSQLAHLLVILVTIRLVLFSSPDCY